MRIIDKVLDRIVGCTYEEFKNHNNILRVQKAMAKYDKEEIERFLKKWYKNNTGYELDLVKPQTFTEKQQWMKLHAVTPLKKQCSDKLKVRKYIRGKIGEQYLIPIIPINGRIYFSDAREIPYEALPERFVIQCNHGSGMTHVVKSKIQLGQDGYKKLQNNLNRELQIKYEYFFGFEMMYSGIKPLIYVTEYLENEEHDLPDYKFYCFNCSPRFVQVATERFAAHKMGVFNLDFSVAPFNFHKFEIPKVSEPKNYNLMLELASILCQDFSDFVRVDFYNIDGRIYFGELTFSSSSGTALPVPIEWNEKLGDMLALPCDIIRKHT